MWMWKKPQLWLAVLGIVAVVGPVTLWRNGLATRTLIRERIRDNEPLDLVTNRIKAGIKDLGSMIERAERAASEAEDRVGSSRKALESEVVVLRQARELLVDGRPTYAIAGTTYSRAQVEDDVQHRLAKCSELRGRIEQLGPIATNSRKLVEQLIDRQREMKQRLVELLARHENAELQQHVQSLSAEHAQWIGDDNQLAQDMQQMELRVRSLEKSGDVWNRLADIPAIDYARESPSDLIAEIDQWIGTTSDGRGIANSRTEAQPTAQSR